jgi:hypothetical protein
MKDSKWHKRVDISALIENRDKESLKNKLNDKSVYEPNTGCQFWLHDFVTGGYGRSCVGRTKVLAHRLSYVLYNGEIGEGLTIDHKCNQPSCINPNHLQAITMRENTLRGTSFSAVNSKKTHCSRGHEYTEETIFRYRDGRRECKICIKARSAASYNKTKQIRDIKFGKHG